MLNLSKLEEKYKSTKSKPSIMITSRFCVLVAGFVSRTQNHKEVFESLMKENMTGVTIPTLHVFGDTDK